jgi:hypothetical protein
MSYLTGWKTVLDLDFTAQTTQTLSPDTTYTIGGLTFIKHNSANEVSNTVLTNGTGITFTPNSSGDCVSGTRSFPLFFLPFSQLNIPSLSWETGIRVWAYISAANPSSTFDNSVLGVGTDSTDWYYIVFRGDGPGGNGLWMRRTIASSSNNTGSFGGTLNNTNNQVMSITVDSLWGNIYHGNMTTGTPAPWPNATRPMNSYTDSTGQQTDGFAGNAGSPGNMGIIFGAMRPASGTAFVSTIARLRVDARG